jgi:hypothetical protein
LRTAFREREYSNKRNNLFSFKTGYIQIPNNRITDPNAYRQQQPDTLSRHK